MEEDCVREGLCGRRLCEGGLVWKKTVRGRACAEEDCVREGLCGRRLCEGGLVWKKTV